MCLPARRNRNESCHELPSLCHRGLALHGWPVWCRHQSQYDSSSDLPCCGTVLHLVYWTVFVSPLGAHVQAVRALLISVGVVTALPGAVMCLLQHHLKRLLAFSTISHAGMFVIGAGLLTPLGLAGTATYVLAHAMVKGSLFLCAGILLHHFESIDVNRLHGRGVRCPIQVSSLRWAVLGWPRFRRLVLSWAKV